MDTSHLDTGEVFHLDSVASILMCDILMDTSYLDTSYLDTSYPRT